ncbi:unnamed protein product [Pieris macdunnoughi]|uniref:Ensconsin-like n=1 Tax=Pieris macdunnoughi TaxID=345717 RepID=A0A821RC10_9NEOP|nr:unnamed protein product [Pieris macdunnoughi]
MNLGSVLILNTGDELAKKALDRARLARERREAEQRKRLDELRAHAAAAQAQREKRDEDRRKRQADQRARDDDRRQQVEERKRAIWEASISRREALLQRERDRTERLERARAARSAPRPAFAFGSSTPRLLEPVDSAGFFWAARRAASTTNVMYASAPLTRRASALQLDSSDTDNKDEADRSPQAVMWSSVARRRTDLVPTVPAPRAPGRAYSMTRLDKLATRPLHSASPSMHHLNRSQTRSGETTPGSRPGSAMSNATGVVRRANSAPRKPRPASIAGTGCNTPRGETGGISATSTPAVSRDGSTVARPATTPRRPRPLSLHVSSKPVTPLGPGEGKPPMHRKPKPSKDQDKSRGKSQSASPGRPLSPSPAHTKETSVDKEMSKSITSERPVDPQQVTQKLEALQVYDEPKHIIIDNKENIETNIETNVRNVEQTTEVKIEVQKPVETEDVQKIVQKESQKKIEPKKESSVEKNDENEMTASMISRRITTEGEAKAALAERRRRAREELERQAELERVRLQREAEEEEERQRQEEERQRREEEEARELAALQRRMEDEKLKKAIEAQQQLERDEAERKVREEVEKQARLREEEEKKRAAEEAEKSRKEELEREEKERLARKQRVEAIMARTRLKKQAEEDKKKQEQDKAPVNQSAETQNQISAQPPVPKIEQVAQDTTHSKSVQDKPLDSANVTTATESVNVTTNATESVNVTTNATESVNVTTVTESVNVSEPDTIKVGVPIISELINVAEPILDLNVSDSKVSEIVNSPNVVDSLNELAKDSAKEVTDNGNVQTEDLLSLATSQPEGKSESWQPHNGNIAPLAPLARTDNKLSQESSGEHSSKMDNANVETNNGNVTNVGHISANFLHSERMSEHNQKEEFTTHNGHGISHPLTLQNAI